MDQQKAVASARKVMNRQAYEPDARAMALLRGVTMLQDDLERSGGAFDLDQVRTLFRGISRQAVNARVLDGSLLAVPGPGNRHSYPTLQFCNDGSVVPGLKAVRDALPGKNPWSVLHFLATPHDALDQRRPVDLLKAGQVDLVIAAAQGTGQQGS